MNGRLITDTVCPRRMDRTHYFKNVLDVNGKLVGTPRCVSCGKPLIISGTKWATQIFLITEEEHIEDLI